MTSPIRGIHHITAITDNAQRTIGFYTHILGLRFIKKTVNFDDPTSYHLYFGNKEAQPGSALTFFVWPGGSRARHGIGQASSIAFSIPISAFSFWVHRLTHFGIAFEKKKDERFHDNYLAFADPDGLPLELVADNSVTGYGWTAKDISGEMAIQGFYTVTLWEDGFEATHSFLTQVLGYTQVEHSDTLFRYSMAQQGIGRFIDVRSAPDFWSGRSGTGSIHHVAFRVADDEAQKAWREQLVQKNMNVTPVIDRKYFHSIYFHEPGGVLFELATDGPGFTVDEPLDRLGKSLQLPSWFEEHRQKIEGNLPTLIIP